MVQKIGANGYTPAQELSLERGRMHDQQKPPLNSWKEIAAYLRVSVRTAQAWEAERRLPVKRLPGGRGMVWADPGELDAWRDSAGQTENTHAGKGQATSSPPVNLGESDLIAKPNAVAGTSRKKSLPGKRFWLSVIAAVAVCVLVMYGASSSKRVGSAGLPPRIAPVTTDPGIESHPDLSPDGKRVAFHLKAALDSASQLVVQQIEGGSRRILGLIDEDCVPRWSPDGQSVAYVRKSTDGFELVTTAPDASQLRVVTRIGTPDGAFRNVNPFMLSWTMDGEAIVYSESAAGKEPLSLFWISLSSGGRRRLTWPTAGSLGDTQPAFSPDGRWLAFVRNPTYGRSDLFLLPVAALTRTKAEPALLRREDGMIDGLVWLPDSSGLVLASNRENGRMALWQLSLAAPDRLLHLTGKENSASFPSSVRTQNDRALELVYASKVQDANVRYSSIGPLMTGQPLAPSTELDFSPRFSAGGSQIAFSSGRSGSTEIWACNQNGTELHQVSKMGRGWNNQPVWSPDGKWIVFTSLALGGNRDIYRVPSEGGRAQPLVSDASEESRASWSRDGKWIYFASNRSGKRQIWKIPASGGAAIQVTFGGGCEGYESADGKTLYYIQDRDQAGLWAVPTSGGPERQVLPNVWQDYWGVTDDAIYYLAWPEHELFRYDLATGRVIHSGHLGDGRPLRPGLSVRHDGGAIVWFQIDSLQCDLMSLRFSPTGKAARWFSTFTF